MMGFIGQAVEWLGGWVEILGWAGSAALLVSLAQANIARLRVINIAGTVVMIAYTVMIAAYPMVALNLGMFAINGYHLIKLYAGNTQPAEEAVQCACVSMPGLQNATSSERLVAAPN